MFSTVIGWLVGGILMFSTERGGKWVEYSCLVLYLVVGGLNTHVKYCTWWLVG